MQINDYIKIFQNVFYPPEGYEIEWVELTTWSLAKDWLRIIAAMIAAGNAGVAKAPLKRPNSYIKGHEKEVSCFHLFYDGKVNIEQEDPGYYQTANGKFSLYLFEKCCTPVNLENGLFHPKIILLQFKKRDETNEKYKRKFRLFISSRNLTWSKYLENGVLLESDLSDSFDTKRMDNNPGKVLKDFLKNYYKKYSKKEPPAALDLKELENAHFSVVTTKGDVVDSNPKLYFGKMTKLEDVIKESFNSIYTKHRITSMKPNTELFDDSCQYICNFKDMYEQRSKDEWEIKKDYKSIAWYVSKDKDGREPLPIHSKQYLSWNERKDELLVWSGSANCSDKGLQGGNEEVLLKFICKGDNNYFPGNGPMNAEFTSGQYFKNDKGINNPVIPEIDEDSLGDKILNVEINYACYDCENKKLKVVINNKENQTVTFWPASCSESDVSEEVKKRCTKCIEFSLSKNCFSKVLLARKDDKVYSLTFALNLNGSLDEKWYGKDYEGLKKSLPFDPLSELSDLIPNQDFFSAEDNVFEKILKCTIHKKDIDETFFRQILKALEEELKGISSNLKSENTNITEEEIDGEETMDPRIFERNDEVNAFKELLTNMMEKKQWS